MAALLDLHNFLYSAVRGICDDQTAVRIDSEQDGKTVNLTVHCKAEDLKFVYAKLSHIRQLAIAIAQRNKSLVNIMILDTDYEEVLEL